MDSEPLDIEDMSVTEDIPVGSQDLPGSVVKIGSIKPHIFLSIC
jgi:hypothetical protein